MPSKVIISTSLGIALVNVPVLSKTIVSASDTFSRNFPPFVEMPYLLASFIADKTVNGMASLSAHEKSTMRNAIAL